MLCIALGGTPYSLCVFLSFACLPCSWAGLGDEGAGKGSAAKKANRRRRRKGDSKDSSTAVGKPVASTYIPNPSEMKMEEQIRVGVQQGYDETMVRRVLDRLFSAGADWENRDTLLKALASEAPTSKVSYTPQGH